MIQYLIEVILEVRKGNDVVESDRELFLVKGDEAIKIE